MDKAYNHNDHEDTLYQKWEKSGAMQADAASDKPAFTIVLPPPNVTGKLHAGHSLGITIQDTLIRYKAMTGHEVLWVPGTDHAAIATETKVIEHLGITSREELGREKFLKEAHKFCKNTQEIITGQTKKMGAWLDWSREAFTMDEVRTHGVNMIFKKLWDDGLIVRGNRMVNWSVGAQSVLADDEVEYEEREGFLYHYRYEIVDSDDFVVVATTRPETLFGDEAVAINPKDERVSQLIGKKVKIPFSGREIPIVADDYVDMEFGTATLKVTPAHDPNDFEIGQRHDLPITQVIGFDGKMMANKFVPEEYQELTREACRKKLTGENDWLVSKKEYTHNVSLCYRTGTVIEPMISKQWFIAVNNEFYDETTGQKTTLKKLTLEAVKDGHVGIIPEKFKKTYYHWIENLRDWCISRQIWWGHQIPVWYSDEHPEGVFGSEDPSHLPEYKGQTFTRDTDTLDTWFSSALWPFSTLGWPEETPDMEKFYPNAVMETGEDILFFWVARMNMFGRYATGRYPFHTTYLHGMVCDEHGKKMSKSKGNGIDPLEVIPEYGADALRLSLVIGTTPGNQSNLGFSKIAGYRNFVNKLWNAARFVQFQIGDQKVEPHLEPKSIPEKWILSRLSEVSEQVRKDLEDYQISSAGDAIYHFIWGEFCDWFIEANKSDGDAGFLLGVFLEILKLAHPLCPFITETCYSILTKDDTPLVKMEYPAIDFMDEEAVESFERLKNVLTEIRKIRAEKGIDPKEKIIVSISAGKHTESLDLLRFVLEKMGNLSESHITEKLQKPERASVAVVDGMDIFVSVPFDPEAEKARLEKEIMGLEKSIVAFQGRLGNKAYVDKAPKALVQQTEKELVDAEAKKQKLIEELNTL